MPMSSNNNFTYFIPGGYQNSNNQKYIDFFNNYDINPAARLEDFDSPYIEVGYLFGDITKDKLPMNYYNKGLFNNSINVFLHIYELNGFVYDSNNGQLSVYVILKKYIKDFLYAVRNKNNNPLLALQYYCEVWANRYTHENLPNEMFMYGKVRYINYIELLNKLISKEIAKVFNFKSLDDSSNFFKQGKLYELLSDNSEKVLT